MRAIGNKGLVLSVLVVLLLGLPISRSRAQLEPEISAFDLYQNGRPAGVVYRGLTDPPSPDHYVEHWVLFANYVYPSARNGVVTEIHPGGARYQDEADFFRRVPWGAGSRYVRVDCADGTSLPGR